MKKDQTKTRLTMMIRKKLKSPESHQTTKSPENPMRKAKSLRKKDPKRVTVPKMSQMKNQMKSPKKDLMKMKRLPLRISLLRRQKRNPKSPNAA